MITDLPDPQFLDELSGWLKEMHRLGRFNSNDCRHSQAAMDELTGKIERIAAKLRFIQKTSFDPDV